MEHAFGREAPYRLGIEEELLLVDPTTLALRHHASEIVPRTQPTAGEVKYDVYEALVETATPVCADAAEGERRLGALREEIRRAGGTVLGAGIHPAAAFGDVVHVAQERYAEVTRQLAGLSRRTPTGALHVHVGMPDPETALTAHNRLRLHLPLLQALSANSPFWHGADSGFQTARAQLFRGYPRAVVPRAFADWDDYARTVEAIVRVGDLPDYTFFWWDVRLHPKLGTVEIRAMDAQSRLGDAIGLAALAHGLAVAAAHEPVPDEELPSEAVSESSYRAGRDGLAATLWWRGALRPVPEVAADALALARAHTRDPRPLEEVERMLRDGTGAVRQRAAHAAGGMPALLRALADDTAA